MSISRCGHGSSRHSSILQWRSTCGAIIFLAFLYISQVSAPFPELINNDNVGDQVSVTGDQSEPAEADIAFGSGVPFYNVPVELRNLERTFIKRLPRKALLETSASMFSTNSTSPPPAPAPAAEPVTPPAAEPATPPPSGNQTPPPSPAPAPVPVTSPPTPVHEPAPPPVQGPTPQRSPGPSPAPSPTNGNSGPSSSSSHGLSAETKAGIGLIVLGSVVFVLGILLKCCPCK